MVMKESKDLTKWRDTPCSWFARLDTVKMSILPKIIYRFKTIPIKISRFFVDTDKLILQFI